MSQIDYNTIVKNAALDIPLGQEETAQAVILLALFGWESAVRSGHMEFLRCSLCAHDVAMWNFQSLRTFDDDDNAVASRKRLKLSQCQVDSHAEFDALKQHYHYCPMIAIPPGSGQQTAGWITTYRSIQSTRPRFNTLRHIISGNAAPVPPKESSFPPTITNVPVTAPRMDASASIAKQLAVVTTTSVDETSAPSTKARETTTVDAQEAEVAEVGSTSTTKAIHVPVLAPGVAVGSNTLSPAGAQMEESISDYKFNPALEASTAAPGSAYSSGSDRRSDIPSNAFPQATFGMQVPVPSIAVANHDETPLNWKVDTMDVDPPQFQDSEPLEEPHVSLSSASSPLFSSEPMQASFFDRPTSSAEAISEPIGGKDDVDVPQEVASDNNEQLQPMEIIELHDGSKLVNEIEPLHISTASSELAIDANSPAGAPLHPSVSNEDGNATDHDAQAFKPTTEDGEDKPVPPPSQEVVDVESKDDFKTTAETWNPDVRDAAPATHEQIEGANADFEKPFPRTVVASGAAEVQIEGATIGDEELIESKSPDEGMERVLASDHTSEEMTLAPSEIDMSLGDDTSQAFVSAKVGNAQHGQLSVQQPSAAADIPDEEVNVVADASALPSETLSSEEGSHYETQSSETIMHSAKRLSPPAHLQRVQPRYARETTLATDDSTPDEDDVVTLADPVDDRDTGLTDVDARSECTMQVFDAASDSPDDSSSELLHTGFIGNVRDSDNLEESGKQSSPESMAAEPQKHAELGNNGADDSEGDVIIVEDEPHDGEAAEQEYEEEDYAEDHEDEQMRQYDELESDDDGSNYDDNASDRGQYDEEATDHEEFEEVHPTIEEVHSVGSEGSQEMHDVERRESTFAVPESGAEDHPEE
ncbi:uncharacterized protein EV422DRAFT_568299 [Fimicolochytrium jonesii]|uniref:uncharacterized protein n=1 Tax=Fimicolochytrium jonesii TaxID=1396493 RepID=UPI0022FEE25D|nr:uncharacterized protein EV422DRAFT_568299 [Fimicolochytrium jonesii]KAI8819842.1 hypothetical protein EV422DRAFT_568299 [Fimicolochytrium jonesii]